MYQILCEKFENEETADKKVFEPKDLCYGVKKESPATPRQKSYLMDLLARHGIQPDYHIDSLTKSEASRLIDGIILQYGKIIR